MANGRFNARDVKVVKTNLTPETLKSSVKCVFETHLKRRRLSRQTLNASVVFTVFTVVFTVFILKVVSRRLSRLKADLHGTIFVACDKNRTM